MPLYARPRYHAVMHPDAAGLREYLAALRETGRTTDVGQRRATELLLALAAWDLERDVDAAGRHLQSIMPDVTAARWLLSLTIATGGDLSACLAELRTHQLTLEDDLREVEAYRLIGTDKHVALKADIAAASTALARGDAPAALTGVMPHARDQRALLDARGRVDAIYYAHALDVAIAAAVCTHDATTPDLLIARATLLDGDAASAGEALALRYLAATWPNSPSPPAMAAIDSARTAPAQFGHALLLWTRLLWAASKSHWTDVAYIHAELSDSASARAVAHAVRAAELLGHEGDSDVRARMERLASGALEHASRGQLVEERIAALLPNEPDGPRLAAALIESGLRDAVRARGVLAARVGKFGRKEAEAWLRLTRALAPEELGTAYEIAAERDLSCAPTYLNAAAVWYWHAGRRADAIRCFTQCGDFLAQTGLLHLRRSVANEDPLVRARAAATPDSAITILLEALRGDIGNREYFTTLESICYEHQRWAPLLELYTRALSACENGSDAYRLSDLYYRLALVERDGQRAPARAASAFANVVACDATHREAVDAVQRFIDLRGGATAAAAELEALADSAVEATPRIQHLRAAALVASHHAGTDEKVRLLSRVLQHAPRDRWAFDALDAHWAQVADHQRRTQLVRARLATATDAHERAALQHRLANVSEELRDAPDAVAHYRAMLEANPHHRGALGALARIYESTEQWRELIEVTDQELAVATDVPLRAMLQFRAGSVLETKFGDLAGAFSRYDAAVRISPACLPAVHGLREIAQKRGDWKCVLDTLQLEAEQWGTPPERASVYAQMAQLCDERLNDQSRCEAYLQKAISVHKESVPAHAALLRRAFARSDWQKVLQHSTVLAPRYARDGEPLTRSDFYWHRGVALVQVERVREGVESLALALEIRPGHPLALESLIETQRLAPYACDYAAVLRTLERAYRLRGDSDEGVRRVQAGLAQVAFFDGDVELAERRFAALLAEADDVASTLAYACIQTLLWNFPRAHEILAAYAAAPTCPIADQHTIARRRADYYAEGEHRFDEALAQLTLATTLLPEDIPSQLALAELLLLCDRAAEARLTAERAIAAGKSAPAVTQAHARTVLGQAHAALEQLGEAKAAYQAALALDAGCAPAAVALARLAMRQNERAAAEEILFTTGRAAAELRGPFVAALIQRELARHFVRLGEVAQAIEAYRGIVHARPSTIEDRLALAELYADKHLDAAIAEVTRVLERDILYAPAYRALAHYTEAAGDRRRAYRAVHMMEQLGFCESGDRASLARLSSVAAQPPRRRLHADRRRSHLVAPDFRSPATDLFAQLAPHWPSLIPELHAQGPARPVAPAEPAWRIAAEVGTVFGVVPDLFWADGVAEIVVALIAPRPTIVMDSTLALQSEGSLRFLLGWALDAITHQYAPLLYLGREQREEIEETLRDLALPSEQRSVSTAAFLQELPRALQDELSEPTDEVFDVPRWLDAASLTARRAGLLAAADIGAAQQGVALLHQAGDTAGPLAIGADLVRYALSSEYSELLRDLSRSA